MTIRRGGIHTLSDLEKRCSKREGHWLWNGCCDRTRPSASIKSRVVSGMHITAIILGRADERGPHQRWFAACGRSTCLSPACLRLGTMAEAHAASGEAGRLKRTLASRMTSAAAARRRWAKANPWMVQWAKESEQSDAEAAHALGLHRQTVAKYRAEKQSTVNPFAQLLGVLA